MTAHSTDSPPLPPATQTARVPGRLNPLPAGRYNLLVLGGGPAGLASAFGAAALGARVALVEKSALGGDSLHAGSIPSKTLIRSAKAAMETRRAEEFGVTLRGGVEVDFAAVMERLTRVQRQIAAGHGAERLLAVGIDLYLGEGRFADPSHLEVNGQQIEFRRAVIATGSRPAIPAIAGLESVAYLTSDTLFRMTVLPRRLGIIGAGPFGCEMAQVFARFGSQVTLFERESRILPQEDADAAAIVEQALLREGITLRLNATELRVEPGAEITVQSHIAAHRYVDPCDTLLVAAGRRPNLERLNLDAAGVKADEQGILVNSFLRTTNRRILAAGDVCSRYKYTHAADALARIVIGNALFLGTDRASSLLVPHCTYTDPEIAQVGVDGAAARALHLHTLTLPLDALDHVIVEGGAAGVLKIHHDFRGTIRGATLVAANASELIGEVTLCMNHGVKLGALAGDIFPYPTESEIFKHAGDVYRNAMITPAIAKLFKRFLRWRR